MDHTTHEVRLEQWENLIMKCQERPQGQTAKQWLRENGISEKTYYYWLRKVRKQTFDERRKELPVPVNEKNRLPSYVEIPAEEIAAPSPALSAITIKTRKSTIEIPSDIPKDLIVELVKAVGHAL